MKATLRLLGARECPNLRETQGIGLVVAALPNCRLMYQERTGPNIMTESL